MANKLTNFLKKIAFWRPAAVSSSHAMEPRGFGPTVSPSISTIDFTVKSPFSTVVSWVNLSQVPPLDFGLQTTLDNPDGLPVASQDGLCIDLGYVVIYETSQGVGAIVPYLRELNISGALGLRTTSQLARARMEVSQRLEDQPVKAFGHWQPRELGTQRHYVAGALPSLKPLEPDLDDFSFSSFSPPSLTTRSRL